MDEGCRRPDARSRRPSATRAGSPRITTKISTSFPGCCRAGCTSIFTICTPTAAGPTIWETKFPIPRKALALLNEWDQELRDCYAGKPSHPVFVALRETISALDIPIEPFSDLLIAFRQDQTVHRYATWNDVFDYCRYSANPVGRLVLYLCGYRDAERQRLSDATCTALQLANFWQDVTRDLEKGRIYIPLEALAAHGLSEDDIVRAPVRRALCFADEGTHCADAAIVCGRNAARPQRRFRLARGYRNVQPRRACGARCHRSHRIQHARAPALDPEIEAVFIAGARSRPAPVFIRAAFRARCSRRSCHGRLAIVEGGCRESVEHRKRTGQGIANEVAQSYAECRRVARASASNFYYAFFMLPQAKRDALCALYAFMRLVDDVSDTVGSAADKQRGLARWRAALDAAAAGDVSSHPILPAFADTIERFHIPPRYFHDLISGAEMDLTVGEYATFDRLREYCYRVAGTVGLTCLHVFGFDDPHAPDLAEKLGIAFQLTNILRDVRSDYEMGRVYLPLEDLAQFGVRPEALARGPLTPEVRSLLEFEAARAWNFYREGVELIPLVHADARAALWALARIYSSLLRRIEARGYDVFSERVRLSTPEKTGILLRARLGWYSQKNVLEERDRDRRRPGGTFLGRRAG